MAFYNTFTGSYEPTAAGYVQGVQGLGLAPAARDALLMQAYSPGTGLTTSGSQGASFSTSFIPEYSQTPILEGIAKYAQQMAPQIYQWGMDQFNKNQGNIDQMMRNAQAYASPQRIAQEMGMAQAGVMQGAEAGRQNAIRDLQSYGIDPSSGRYAALDQANRVMTGAAAAGAGNQQRMATEAAGNTREQQALSASMQNVQTGYGASKAMNDLLGTGMQLKYPPLGTVSADQRSSFSLGSSGGGGSSQPQHRTKFEQWGNQSGQGGAMIHEVPLYAQGGEVPDELSKSNGNRVDDVPANLTAGEFVIPKDIVEWKGQEFFYKLMAQARKMRAMGGEEQPATGYGASQDQDKQSYADGGSVARGNLASHVAATWVDESGKAHDIPENYDTVTGWSEGVPHMAARLDPTGRALENYDLVTGRIIPPDEVRRALAPPPLPRPAPEPHQSGSLPPSGRGHAFVSFRDYPGWPQMG